MFRKLTVDSREGWRRKSRGRDVLKDRESNRCGWERNKCSWRIKLQKGSHGAYFGTGTGSACLEREETSVWLDGHASWSKLCCASY